MASVSCQSQQVSVQLDLPLPVLPSLTQQNAVFPLSVYRRWPWMSGEFPGSPIQRKEGKRGNMMEQRERRLVVHMSVSEMGTDGRADCNEVHSP